MTQFIVIATVPTAYQYNSCRFFGKPEKLAGGGYHVRREFATREEAIDYLMLCIDEYAATDGTEEEIEAMRREAASGRLEYDACIARVKEVEVQEEEEEEEA